MWYWRFCFYLMQMIGLVLLPGCGCAPQKEKLVVINVLDTTLYDDCHIKGSINISFEDFAQRMSSLNKNDEIIIYCSNYQCTASGYAVEMLQKQGFKKVAAYEAGMAAWYQEGLPVEGVCKQPYLMHKVEPLEQNKTISVVSTEELKRKIKSLLAVSITP